LTLQAWLAQWLAPMAVGAGAVVWAAYLVVAWRYSRLRTRPILFAASILGALPTAHVGASWAGWLAEDTVRLERPTLALPCTLVVIWVTHRLLRLSALQSRLRRTATETLICLSVLTAALATVGAELGCPLDRLAVLVAIDRSRSIDLVPDAEGRIRAELQVAELGMRDDDRVGTVVFAADAAVQDPLRPRTRLPPPQQVELGRDGTDIGAAIRRALAEVPSDSAARIVVISDGVNTRGDPLDAAAAAVAAGVPVDAIALDQARVPNVRVVAVRMPPRASQGEWLGMRIVTESTHDAPLAVRVFRNGKLLRQGEAKVRRGEDVLTLQEQAPGPGLHRYDVAITAKQVEHDQAPEDNVGSTFVRVRGEAAALVMERDPALAAALVRALEAAAFRVDVVGPGGVPADLAAFAAYDLLVLSDVRASDLAPTGLRALATYVRDLGGGLLLMGGDHSLGPGGYGRTPIEEVSPVSFDLKQERRRASLAEVIAIDYSGSMGMRAGKRTKLDLANEAAVRSAQLLGAGDRLGVMHVDTDVRWTLPLAPVQDKTTLAERIRNVGPGGGGIYVDLTLQTAYAALYRETVNLKHVLLFSDGSDAEQRGRAPALVAEAKRRGVTTSVVALGRGSDVPALEQLSQLGGGRFYLIEDATRLPSVFAQETILASRSAINELLFRPTLGSPGPPTQGIDFSTAPALAGYVVTIPKSRSQVLLRGPEGDPLLAAWPVGIGQTAAFTSDFKDRWGARWTDWHGAARLFAQLGRHLSRRADDPRVRLDADASGGQLHIRATVVDDDGLTESFRQLVARVGGPDGLFRDVPLEAVGAGAYAASLPLARPGAFVATAIDQASGQPVGTTGAVLTAGEELRPTGTDRALLSRLAQLTGGRLRDTLAGVFDERQQRRLSYRSLLGWLVSLAACALLLSVAARRLVLPQAVTALPARWRRARAEARRPRTAARAQQQQDQSAALALLKARRAAAQPEPSWTDRTEPVDVPRFARPAPAPAWPAAAPSSTAPPTLPRAQAHTDAPAPSRPLSTAELLLARRRGRK
jgi:Ca-activated chloride channel family protein